MSSAPPDGAYGSGKRVLDESRAAGLRDYLAQLIQMAKGAADNRDEIERRLGRVVLELDEVMRRLGLTYTG